MSKYKFEPVPDDTVEERSTRSTGDFDSTLSSVVKFVKVPQGENAFRILGRSWKDTETWGSNWAIDVWVHRNIGPDKQTYLCLLKMKGEDCPICEAIADMDADADEKTIDKIKSKNELYCYIIDRATPKEGVKVWRLSQQIEKDIQIRSKNRKTGAIIQITDPDDGYDVTFRREGQGLNTRYPGLEVERDSSPLSEKSSQADAWLDFIATNPLPDQLIYYSYERIDQAYRGKRGTANKAGGKSSGDKQTGRNEKTKQKAAPAEPEKIPASKLDTMDLDDLKQLVADYGFDSDIVDEDSERATRRAVRTALEEAELLDTEEKAEEEEPAPPKKTTAAKPAGKKKQLPKVDPVALAKMDDEELSALVKEYNLDVETNGVPVKRMRREITEALEAKDLLESEDDGGETEEAEETETNTDDEDDGEGGSVGRAKAAVQKLRPKR